MAGSCNRHTIVLMKRSWNRFRAATHLVTQDLTLDTFLPEAVLWRFKLPEPIVVLVAGGAGLVVWQFVQGG